MPRNKRSTEISAEADNAWPVDELSGDDVDLMCTVLDVKARGSARVRELYERLADPEVVARIVEEKAPFELVLLECIVDFGGFVDHESLWKEACRRAGVDRSYDTEEIFAATAVVGCALRAPTGEGAAAVFDACYQPLAALLRGVSLPATPTALPPAAAGARERLRDTILAAARTAHRLVKENKDGSPSRTNRRKFEADVAAAETDVLWQGLASAVEAGLVARDGSGLLVPDLERLRSVARDGVLTTWADPAAGGLVDLLARQPIVTTESLLRAEQRDKMPRVVDVFRASLHARRIQAALRARLRSLVGAWVGHVDGVEVVAVAPPPEDAQGHVLPNFDVVVGPGTGLETLLDLAIAAELVRIDTMVTLRLTPASVRAACRLAIGPERILEVLGRVGPRGVPDNVAQSIVEWCNRVVEARVLRGRVVVVADSVIDRLLATEASAAGLARIGPGVVHVEGSVTDAQLHARLDAVGVTLAPDLQSRRTSLRSSAPPIEVANEGERGSPRATLRLRVQAAMSAKNFRARPVVIRDASHVPATDPAGDQTRPPPAVVAKVREELSRWHGRLKVHARRKVPTTALDDEDLLSMLAVVDPQTRAGILRRCTKLAQVRRRLTNAIGSARLADWAREPERAPRPEDFPRMAPHFVRMALDAAVEDAEGGAVVRLLLQTAGHTAVTEPLSVEKVEPRGRDVVVLATEVQTQASVAYPLTQVASVLRDGDVVDDASMLDELLYVTDRLLGRRH
jgi:hypothetical protein